MFTPAARQQFLRQHDSADYASKELLLDNLATLAIYASEAAYALDYDVAYRPLHDGECSPACSEPAWYPDTDADGREYARHSRR